MKHIEIEGNIEKIIAGLFLVENPNVCSEELQVRLVNTKSAGKKLDFRIWTDSFLNGKGRYQGPTKKGFRMTLEQYERFKNEIIPAIDKKLVETATDK